MNIKINLLSTFVIIILTCLITMSCDILQDGEITPTPSPSPDPGTSHDIEPPSAINAGKIDGMVYIEWEDVPGSEAYQLFIDADSQGFVKMDDGFTKTNFFTYKEYNYTNDLSYSVRCWKDNDYISPPSRCSNYIHLSKDEVMKALKPRVKSFTLAGQIIVSWEANPYATGYELYKYLEPECKNGMKVYEGENLTYIDSNVIMGQFYYYKIVNREKYTAYEASPYNFGVAAYDGKDDYEDNNDQSEATILELGSMNKATIYFYKDSAGNNLIDYDWYYIQVPAYTEIPIIIEDFTYTADDDLYITIGEQERSLIKEGDGYKFYNPGNTVRNMFFSITVNPEQFYNKYGGYTIVVEE